MTTQATNQTAAQNNNTEKAVQAFYSPKDEKYKGPIVSLWVNKVETAGAPDFDGSIGDTRVAGYLKKGPKAGFISFVDPKEKDASGYSKQVGTANVVVNSAGIPKLVTKLTGSSDSIWSEVSLKLPVDLQVAAGLDLGIQVAKKAAHAASKANA